MEYTSGQDYRFSKANSLIKNLKKTLDRKGSPEWAHKGRAIREIASIFSEILPEESLEGYTIVPVPPSKCKSDSLHDDRLIQILKLMTAGFKADVREILYLEESIEASHDTDDRPSPDDLEEVYKVKKSLCKPPPEKIIIFDDMITAGAHFRACKNILQRLFPEAKIIGVFFTRRKFFSDEDEGD
jgi:predicted amidophosphoribosyltransferase